MKQFYQTEWFKIKFSSFAELDSQKVADASFYDKFYDKFYEKYNSYDMLPDDWRKAKQNIADFIIKNSTIDRDLLSIGCGNGYIEKCLADQRRSVIAIEPSVTSSRFLQLDSRIKLYN